MIRYISHTWKRVVTAVLAAVLGLGVGTVVGVTRPWESREVPVITVEDTVTGEDFLLTVSTVESLIQPAADLVTCKYNYKDTDMYEDYKQLFGKRIPFTTDKVVFTYEGVVSVGVDMSKVNCGVDNDGKIITVTLPALEVQSNEIDEHSFAFPFESNSIFNSTSMEEYTKLFAALKEKKAQQVLEDTQFMDTARANTERVLEDILHLSDVTEGYKVVFAWAEQYNPNPHRGMSFCASPPASFNFA